MDDVTCNLSYTNVHYTVEVHDRMTAFSIVPPIMSCSSKLSFKVKGATELISYATLLNNRNIAIPSTIMIMSIIR